MNTFTTKYLLFFAVLGAVVICPSPAQADAEKEVIAAARAIIEAANAGDRSKLDKLQKFHSRFLASGGLLQMPRDADDTSSTTETDEDQEENDQQEVTWRFSHWKHPEVHVNGDMAFMTGYLHVSREIDGESKTFNLRDTCIFEKQDGNWVRIHHHTSTLNIATDE